MKTIRLLAVLPLLLISVRLAAAEPGASPTARDALGAAVKKLADKPNYSWKTVMVVPDSARFKPGPTEGKLEKDGYTSLTLSFGDNTTEIVMKGDKAAVKVPDGNWQMASELENAEGPGRFLAVIAKTQKSPAVQAVDLIALLKDVKEENGVFSGELTGDGAKKQYRFGQPKEPKGWVKFWLKDGVLAKLETKLEAKLEINGDEIDGGRTITTDVSDVGTTKVNVPEEARKKLM